MSACADISGYTTMSFQPANIQYGPCSRYLPHTHTYIVYIMCTLARVRPTEVVRSELGNALIISTKPVRFIRESSYITSIIVYYAKKKKNSQYGSHTNERVSK